MGNILGKTLWEEGVETGRIEAARQMLRQFLMGKFGSLSEAVGQRIEACSDFDRLTAAAQQVASLNKPDDLQL